MVSILRFNDLTPALSSEERVDDDDDDVPLGAWWAKRQHRGLDEPNVPFALSESNVERNSGRSFVH